MTSPCPVPWCNSTNSVSIRGRFNRYCVECVECGCATPWKDTQDEAFAIWEERPDIREITNLKAENDKWIREIHDLKHQVVMLKADLGGWKNNAIEKKKRIVGLEEENARLKNNPPKIKCSECINQGSGGHYACHYHIPSDDPTVHCKAFAPREPIP